MEILYKTVMDGKNYRKIYINGHYYTKLRCNSDGTVFSYNQHPRVNLAKLFNETVKDGIGFYSAMELTVRLRAKGI